MAGDVTHNLKGGLRSLHMNYTYSTRHVMLAQKFFLLDLGHGTTGV